VIVPVVRIADPRLFLVVARLERRIDAGDRWLDRRPLRPAILIFGRAGLKASLVFVRAGIAMF
jgi:hypothetical protein